MKKCTCKNCPSDCLCNCHRQELKALIDKWENGLKLFKMDYCHTCKDVKLLKILDNNTLHCGKCNTVKKA